MNKFIKVFSIFSLIWSSIAIVNGAVLLLLYVFFEDALYDYDYSDLLEGMAIFQVILTFGMIAFICFLQSLGTLKQLKNRN